MVKFSQKLQLFLHLEILVDYVAEQLRLENEKKKEKELLQKLGREDELCG